MLLITLAGLLVVVLIALRSRALAVDAGNAVDAGDATAPVGDGRVAAALASRWILPAVGVATSAAVWWCWGVANPMPVVHDEFAYVLQAKLFASGRWTAPSPPLPAFWEQAHVLVEPALASKYPPGHALVLALGAVAGWVPLMPIVLAGLSGALLFALARRVSSGAVALLTWVVWLASPMVQRFTPGFYSESTTMACWLGGWLALLRWREGRERRWLLVVALVIGLGAITRPLTMLVYAIPVGLVVLHDVARRAAWRDLGLAMALGTAVLLVLPLWSQRTTGRWNQSPVGLYTQQYMPWDVPGFGYDTTPPTRALTPDMAALTVRFRPMHEVHAPATLLATLRLRVGVILHEMWRAYDVLMPLAAIGLLALTGASLVALATSVLLVLAYLAYAAPPGWTIYYLEITPVLAYLTASGVAVIAAAARRAPGWSVRSGHWAKPGLTTAIAAGALILLVPAHRSASYARHTHRLEVAYRREFAQVLASLPKYPAVLFIRYAPNHNPHTSLVRNEPDLASAPVWVVYDRGVAENARLLALAPHRAPYIYDEARAGIFLYRGEEGR